MIAIYNTEGDLQCKYNYDAWGNHRIGNARNELIYDSATGVIATGYESHIAILNPIRYRGYYYDNETRLYYLQSRYYDATLCRFLNRDNVNYLEPESIHGLNLYAYCNNNPVIFADPSGHFAISTFLIGLAVSWVISSIASYYLGKHLVSGASSLYGGVQTIVTGISLLSYGPVGWVLGCAAIALGAVNIAFGTAELQQHFTGSNWIHDIEITGKTYNFLYIGSSLISTAICIGGSAYMNSTAGRLAHEIQQNAQYWDKRTFNTRYGSLKYHHREHGCGLTPTQYTQSALDFSSFNSSSFRYIYNYKYQNASWYFNNIFGTGGYFTGAGKIITFWF